MQVPTHAGGLPGSPSYQQKRHFSTTPECSCTRTPYGHAAMQYLQPMHFSSSTSTTPESVV